MSLSYRLCVLRIYRMGCVRTGVGSGMIPQEKEKFDQALVIGDKTAVINHGEDFITIRPLRCLNFFVLQLQSGRIRVVFNQIDIVKSAGEIHGQRRASVIERYVYSQLF